MDQCVTLYGANRCYRTGRMRGVLDSLEVGFHYVNVDANPMGKEEVRELNGGEVRLPTVVIEGKGTLILTEPSEDDLRLGLAEAQVTADRSFVQ